MYISELNLHGFKSFAKKQTILLDSGVTGIVGPNGCGKSTFIRCINRMNDVIDICKISEKLIYRNQKGL